MPRPSPDAPEKEKRQFLDKVVGFVCRRRGALRGKSVWIVNYYPYGKNDRLVVLGAAPAGAKLATGKGSVQASATLLKGIPPKKPIYSDTGAVDDIISSSGRRIVVTSVKDKNTKLPLKRRFKFHPPRQRELGGGIVETKTGPRIKRHIKLF